MTSSERWVAIPDCQTVATLQRGLTVYCPHFPDENPHGLKDQLYVHFAVLHPGMPSPPPFGEDETGHLVVLERFVKLNKVDVFHECVEETTDE